MSNALLAVVDALEEDLTALRGLVNSTTCALNGGEVNIDGNEFYAMFSLIINKLKDDKDVLRSLAVV